MTVNQIKSNMGVGELNDWHRLFKIEEDEAKQRERELRVAHQARQNRVQASSKSGISNG